MLEENNELSFESDEDSILESIFSDTENKIPESQPITMLREDSTVFNLDQDEEVKEATIVEEEIVDVPLDAPIEVIEGDQQIATVEDLKEDEKQLPQWTVEIETNPDLADVEPEPLNERKVDLNEMRETEEPSDQEVGEMIQKMQEEVLIPSDVPITEKDFEKLEESESETEPGVTGLYYHRKNIERLVANHQHLLVEDTTEDTTDETDNSSDISISDDVEVAEPIEEVMDEVSKVMDLVSENDNSELLNIISEANQQELEKVDQMSNISVEGIILSYYLPSDLSLIKEGIPDGKRFDDLNENQVMLAYDRGKSKFLKDVCEKIYEEVRIHGTEVLNKYPGLTKKKLEDYLFKIRMDAQTAEINVIKQFEEKKETKYGVEQEVSYTQRYGVNMMPLDDPHQQQVDQANDGRKKAQKQREPGCNPKLVFKIENVTNTNPFCDEVVMNSFFDKSCFHNIFQTINKGTYGEPLHGNAQVTVSKQTILIPIVDFPQEGVRFVCIDTTSGAASRAPYQYNPIEVQSRIRFPNDEFATNYSIYILYSNDCIARPDAVGRAIYKILNWRYMKDSRRVLLSARQSPIAYTTEKSAMHAFEEQHSTISGYGRVRHNQITLIGFVTEQENQNDYANRFLSRGSAHTFKDLLESHSMYYIASIHYLESKQIQMDQLGRQVEYILYTITQYTESRSCLLLDGLPVIMGALSKEHKEKYGPNMAYSIVYEYDYTALVSPSVSNIIRGSLNNPDPELVIDASSYNQSLNSFVSSYIIVDDRFKTRRAGNGEMFDDAARNDYRLFYNSPEVVKRQFLTTKVTDPRNLDISNFFGILNSLGYVPYKEPKPLAFCLTQLGLDNLDRSPIVDMMFKININDLQQENAFDYTNSAINDFYNHKYSLMSGFNNADTINIMQMFTSGVDLMKTVKGLFTGK